MVQSLSLQAELRGGGVSKRRGEAQVWELHAATEEEHCAGRRGWKGAHVTVTMHQSVKLPKCCLYSHIMWMVSATVAANGMNARAGNLHLLHEPQAATFSSNTTSLFQGQGHDTIKLAFSPF